MDHNIALPNLPSCLAVQVRAKYLGGIHLLCELFHMHSLQMNPRFSSFLGLLSTGLGGSTLGYIFLKKAEDLCSQILLLFFKR